VLIEEIDEILFEQPHIRFVEKGHREGEDLYAAYGQTMTGRWLIVFFVLKSPHEALMISGRDMNRKEQRLYAKR